MAKLMKRKKNRQMINLSLNMKMNSDKAFLLNEEFAFLLALQVAAILDLITSKTMTMKRIWAAALAESVA